MFDPRFNAFASVSVGTSAVQVSAGQARRSSILIQNVHASNTVYVGPADTITAENTIQLSAGDSVEFSDVQGPIFAVADGADTDVRFLEFG